MSSPAAPLADSALNAENRVPLYHQIFLILRAKIFDGEYPSGGYLPGERELGEAFQVSRITAVRALNELAAAGLVVRERGRGTRVQIVGKGSVARGPSPAAMTPVALDEASTGRTIKNKIYTFTYGPAPSYVVESLNLQEGELVQEAVRASRFDGKPFNHLVTYVPEDIGRTWSRAELEVTPMVTLLKRAGVEVDVVEERITATLADMVLAERLEVAVGSPLIKITRLSFDINGRGVDYFVGHYPPDRYQYVVTLPRGADSNRLHRSGG